MNKDIPSKILLISWGVFPSSRASSIVVSNLATYFSKNELILLGQKPYKTVKGEWKDSYPEVHYVGKGLERISRGRRFLRWIMWLQFPFIMWKLMRLVEKQKPEVIVTVFPDEYYLFASYLLSKWKKLPLFPWFHNTYLENRSGSRKLFANWFQPRLLKHSKCLFVLSEGMKTFYNKKYPSIKVEVIPHSFQIPSLGKLESSNFSVSGNSPVKLAITGTINHTCLDATQRFCAAIRDRKDLEINIFTKVSKEQITKYKLTGENLKFRGFMPSLEDLRQELLKCQFSVITHGFEGGLSEIEYKTIFPTRTVPLLYSGKPIIAHSPEDSFLTNFLIKYDCAEVITSKNQDEILAKIDYLINNPDRCLQLVQNAYKTSQLFDNVKVATDFCKTIDSYISK